MQQVLEFLLAFFVCLNDLFVNDEAVFAVRFDEVHAKIVDDFCDSLPMFALSDQLLSPRRGFVGKTLFIINLRRRKYLHLMIINYLHRLFK